MAITHYVRVDDDEQPTALFRGRAGPVDRWDKGKWVNTGLFQPQLAGLGGATDYRVLPDDRVAEWKKKLG